MGREPWSSWFETARAAGNGGDLALLADEAPDTESELAARVAAIQASRTAGAYSFATVQLERLREKSPETAEALRGSIHVHESALPGLSLAVVFAGHMIDGPTRHVPRFPETAVSGVAARIRESIHELGIRPGDRAVSSAAAGGDLLLAEAALEAGMEVTVCLPFEEPRFLQSSVNFGGEAWRNRFQRLTGSPGATVRVLPPSSAPGANDYERANRWMVYLALASGAVGVRGLMVWDGKPGDGPGGAGHMASLLNQFNVPLIVMPPLAS